jgi:hypothetical protein
MTTAALAAALLAGLGCGASDPRQAVSGAVTWKGQPLAAGMIRFLPAGGAGTEQGAVITDGRYEIPKGQGLLPGTYAVKVFSPDPNSGQGPPDVPPGERGGYPAKERIPAKYNAQTTLTFEVKAGTPNTFDVSIE